MSGHDYEEMEKHFDKLLISIDSVQLNFATEFYSVLEKYAEHYAAKQQPESTAILEAAKELGRVDALQELAKFGSDQISVYEEGEGFRWHHSHYMRTISEGNTVESLLAYLDAHREVVV